MTAAARKLQGPEASEITSTWWRHKRVLVHLDVDPKTLRARMNDNPDHIEQPWVNIGSARRPEYRWLAGEVDHWWIEVNRWRASTSAMEAGACAGATRTAGRGAGSARPPPKPVEPERKQAAFSGYAKHWLDLKRPDWKPSYYRSTEQIVRVHLVGFFGDRDLRTIGPEDIQRYKAAKAQVLKPKTVNNHVGLLSTMFKDAVAWGYCERNPAYRISPLPLPPQRFRFWDKDQSAAFLDTVARDAPAWSPFFLTALRTGLRAGELFALTWDDVDFAKGVLHVRRNWTHGVLVTPKSGKSRDVPMTPELVGALRDHRHLAELVFPTADGGYLDGNKVKRTFWRCIRIAGVPRIAFHDLRHSYASQLVMAGVPLKAVQELLGHADISTTQRYAHLSPGATADYVKVLDGQVASPSVEQGTPTVER